MSVTSLVQHRANLEKEKIARIRLTKKLKRRYLGGTVHTCFYREFSCSKCIMPISPGMQYRRDRYVQYYEYAGKDLFRYERTHWPECHAPTEEDYREIIEQIERKREEERKQEEKKAA